MIILSLICKVKQVKFKIIQFLYKSRLKTRKKFSNVKFRLKALKNKKKNSIRRK